MPLFVVELKDGRKFKIDADREPTPEESSAAINDSLGIRRPGSMVGPRQRVDVTGKKVFTLPEFAGDNVQVPSLKSAASDAWADINKPLVDITPAPIPEPVRRSMGPVAQTAAGIGMGAAEATSSLTSPLSIATLGTGGALKSLYPAVSKALSWGFGGLMGYQTAKEAGELLHLPPEERNPLGITKHVTAGLMAGGMAAASIHDALKPMEAKLQAKAAPAQPTLLPRAAAAVAETPGGTKNASDIPGATGLPQSEVRPPVGQEAPLQQQGQAPGAQPQPAPGQAPAAPHQEALALAPEHKALIDEEAAARGAPVVYETPTDPNEPFAGNMAQADRQRGVIRVNPQATAEWLARRVPKGQERLAIQSLLSEEGIHLATSDEDALAYHDTLTGLERAAGQRIYGGAPLNPTQLGHEMLRMRMQQLARMDVRETLDRSTRERWTVKSLLALNDTIRSIRETLGTKASKEGLAILDRVQQNLDAAIVAAGGEQPAARRKETDRDEDAAAAISQLETLRDKAKNGGREDDAALLDGEIEKLKGVFPGYNQESFPAARLKRQKGQEDFILPPLLPEAQVDRPSAAEAKGATARPTVVDLNKLALDQPGGVKPVDPTMLDKPYSLGRFLTEGSRVIGPPTGKLNAKGEPIYQSFTPTLSRAIVALEKNGEIDLVHAYQDPNDLARLTDPAKSLHERAHVSIRELLAQGYKPVAGFLLKEPVKDFYQHFDSVADYERALGKPAEEAYGKMRQYMGGEAIKGTESKTGKAFAQPDQELEGQARETGASAAADVLAHDELPDRPKAAPGEGAYEVWMGPEDVPPITEREAASIIDHIGKDHGFTITGIKDAMLKLLDKDTDKDALSAFRKLGAKLRETFKRVPDETLLSKLAEQIYETHATSQDYETFLRRTLAQGPTRVGPAPIPKAPAETGTKEIILPPGARPLPVGQGRGAPPGEIPPPQWPERYPPRQLTPAESARVTADAAQRFPEKDVSHMPATEPFGYGKGAGKEAYYQYSPETLARIAEKRAMFKGQDLVLRGESPPGEKAPPLNPRQRARLMGEEPAARMKEVQDSWDGLKRAMVTFTERRQTKKSIVDLFSATKHNAEIDTADKHTEIVLASTSLIDPNLKGRARTRAIKAAIKEAKERREADIPFIASGVRDQAMLAQIQEAAQKELSFSGAQHTLKEVMERLTEKHVLGMFGKFEQQLANAEAAAKPWFSSTNPFRRIEAKKWVKNIGIYRKNLEYAKAHWKEQDYQDGADAYRKVTHDVITYADANGVQVTERKNYIPGLWEGEFWGDDTINWGGRRLLGGKYQLEAKFKTPYDAIEAGPYYLRSHDIADLAAHRTMQIHRMVERRMAFLSLQGIQDPAAHQPVAVAPKAGVKNVKDPITGEVTPETIWSEPTPEHVLVRFQDGSRPLAVRRGYESVVRDMVLPGFLTDLRIGDVEIGKAAIIGNQMLKNGAMLMWDTFHPGRVSQYGLSLMGFKDYGFQGGASALTIPFESLDEAVSKGLVSRDAADWAKQEVTLNGGRGRTIKTTNHGLARQMVRRGLNASKSADMLYKDAVEAIPFFGKYYHRFLAPYNNALFDRFIPGLITESAVRQFKKINAAHPELDPNKLMVDVNRDINMRFGNMGQQGIFRNRHLQQIAQAFFLAPLWQEGLFQSELRFAARLATGGQLRAMKGLPRMGALGESMAKGLGAYLVGTQIINLITRGQFTWDNPEDGHKMDAWIPIGEGSGIWLSPLSVFAEKSHDIVRMHEADKKVMEIAKQMGENAMGPLGKMATVLATGKSPSGQVYSTTVGRLKGAAAQVTPTVGVSPIAISPFARAAGHAVAPNLVSPNPPGRFMRQFIASAAGTKTEVSATESQRMYQKAREFMDKHGLKPETGWLQVQTDEPSYSKLRSAIRNGDNKEAKTQFEAMVESHGGGDKGKRAVLTAMKANANRPFTGSQKAERLFRQSLSDKEQDEYQKAVQQKMAEYEAFEQWFVKQP